MNILFVLENYHPHVGGVESVFKDLAEGLVRQGHRVIVVTHHLQGTARKETVNGVSIHRVPCFDSRYWFTFMSLPTVFRFAKHADIIHTTTYNGAPPAWLASRLLGKPIIITVHEVLGKRWRTLSDGGQLGGLLHQFLERVILSLGFNNYVAVSRSTARQLAPLVPEKKIKVVYNGLDYSFWDPASTDGRRVRRQLGTEKKFVALFYGRPGISKGLEVLVRALPAIIHNIPSFHVVAIMSRDKAYQKRVSMIHALARALGVEGHITFLRPVPREDLPSYVAAADCVIVPSLSEGFGFAVAEASAMGKIVVASNVDSIPEVVSGKWVLFEAGNASSLAEAVMQAYHGRYNLTRLRRFALAANIQNYLNTYGQFVEDGT